MNAAPTAHVPRMEPGAGPVQRSDIIAAAADLFAAHGYHGASMHDVGEKVGLLKGSLYAHVANKEEMLLEIVSTVSRRILETVEPVLTGEATPAAKIRRGIAAYLSVALDDPAALLVYAREGKHLRGQPADWYKQARQRHVSAWQGVFAEGIRAGSFRPDLDAETCALAAISACEAMLDKRPVAQDAGALATAIGGIVLDGCELSYNTLPRTS